LLLAAQAIPPIPTHFSVAWSVCRLSHFKLLDGYRCNGRYNDTLC